MFGENSDKAREKFKEELEETHGLFKDFIRDHRPALDLEKSQRVSTGLVHKRMNLGWWMRLALLMI